MKLTLKQTAIFLTGISMIGFLVSFTVFSPWEIRQEKKTDSDLCIGNYWTEAEGKAFLEKMKGTYSTSAAWKDRAILIRTQILKGTGLEKFPEKCPLNPVIGEKRVYDGYQVQNVAFESLPGVYVTGSLYTPLKAKGKIPGILSPHGHWSNPKDYGRYRPDAQLRFAAMARMGAMVFGYDMVGYGQMGEMGWNTNTRNH